MKKIDLDSVISNEYLNNELKNTFEKIKLKVKNNNIILKNLDKNRNINEQLIDTFNGEIANLITKYFLYKNLNKDKYIIVDYNSIRTDNGRYPDIFDLLVVKKNNKEIIDKIIKKLHEYNNYYLNKSHTEYGIINFHIQKNFHNFITKNNKDLIEIEIKSSALKSDEDIYEKPIIAYCLDKNLEKFKRNFKKLPINIIEYLKLKYNKQNNKNIEELKELYLKENFFIKDIHSQVFYNFFKDTIKYKKFLKINFDKIDYKTILNIVPKIWYYDIFTTNELLVNDNINIGMLSQKLKAVYHLNKIKDIGLTVEKIIESKFAELLNKSSGEMVVSNLY